MTQLGYHKKKSRCLFLEIFWKISFTLERQKVIKRKVNKLIEVGFISDVIHPEWLTNVVLIKKANGKIENMH